jgi:hypothetical protein
MIGGTKAKARDNASIRINVGGAEARFRAGRVAQLSQHLPCGQLLRQLGSGLLMGKLADCLPVVARPWLPGSTGPIPEVLASVQVAINKVTRSVVGHKREDHIPIVDLLEAAKFLSLNQPWPWQRGTPT